MHEEDSGLFAGRRPDDPALSGGVRIATSVTPGADVVLQANDVHVRYRIRMARTSSRTSARAVPNRMPPRYIHAVRGVSIDLREGQCLGIVGDNGAGKSSFVRALAGFEALAHGSVFAASSPRLLGVGGATKASWTGLETIEAGLRALRVPLGRRRYLTQDIIDFTGLGERLESPVTTYSRGMQNRLQFAINTAVSAQILCIDEGFGGADGHYRARAEERINRMLANSGAMVIVSHSLRMLTRLATEAAWLHDGHLVLAGAPSHVLPEYQKYLDTPNP